MQLQIADESHPIFTHLALLRSLRSAVSRSAPAASSLSLRRAAAGPVRSRAARGAGGRETLAGRPPTMWRYRELMPIFDGETAGHPRRRVHSPLSRQDARPDPGPRAAVRQGRVAQPDQLVQGARPVGGDHAREVPRRADHRASDRRQRRQRGRRLRGRRGARVRSVHARDVKQPFVDECRLYGARGDARRRADYRCRPGRRRNRARRSAGTTCRRSRSRTASKARRRWPTSWPSRWTWQWPDWIVYPTGGGTGMVGMWKAFEELEAIGWMPRGRRPRMVSVQAEGCAPIVRAFERRHREGSGLGERDDGRRRPAGAAAPSAISSSCARSGKAAARRSPCRIATMIDGMLELGRPKGSAPPRKAARRSPPCGG